MPAQIEVKPEVREFHNACMVADLHADTWLWNYILGYNPRKFHRSYIPRNPFFNHIDIPRAVEGGLKITGQGVVAHPFRKERCFMRGHQMITRIRKGILRNSSKLQLALTADSAREIVALEKIAVFIGVEGCHILSGKIEAIEHFYLKGARYFTLGHFSENEAVYSSNDVPNADKPLKPWGKEVVREIERLGMMIDLAHVAPGCFWDAMRMVTRPVIVSHIGMRALHNHWRNLTDDQVRAVGENGGVIGIIFQPGFLCGKFWYCPMDTVIAHIEHCMNIAGEDHVALGSDWDGMITTPEGLEDVTGLPRLTQRLLDRGHSKETLKKILGENFLRVFKQVCG